MEEGRKGRENGGREGEKGRGMDGL